MSQLLAILQAKLRMSCHTVASVRTESKLKIGFISLAALILWIGAFVVFMESFHWLLRFGSDFGGAARGIGNIIMTRLLGVFALTVFFMLIFSNVLVSFSTIYRSREVTYLIQAPMSFQTFFVARFAECVTFSSWALAYLGSPLLFAYGITNRAPWGFYVAPVAFFIPFVTLPAVFGATITLVLARIFPRLRLRLMVLLAVLAVLSVFFFGREYFSAARFADDTILPALLDVSIQTQSPYLPSYWATRGILAAATGDYAESAFNWMLLTANALMALWVVSMLARWLFYPGWSSLAGSDRNRVKPLGKGILGRVDRLLKVLPNPTRALVIKDIKLFWRDPTQWSQFVIFFGIMAIYIANLRNTSRYYEQEFWRSWIASLNIGACTLILATLTSRFVFPLISLEGRRFWILGLAPLTLRHLVLQKFFLSIATTSLFTVGIAILSAVMLKLDPIYFALSVYSVLITNFGLAGLAVGLGALYPSFQQDNPARIVSGMGGTLNLILSIAYITFIVGAQAFALQWRVLNLFASDQAFYTALATVVVFITMLSAFCVVVPLRLGLKNLQDMEL
ncbi:MAG: hypothetical protein GWP08_06745 [Nitrospiraceae bacterium]|nr:hypothetical protein [Nitrospiraceae bacterium]